MILMAGLQGSGKTTACAKLARHLGEGGKDVALAACDVYRPAAVEQLVTVGERAGAHVYEQGTDARPGRDRRVGARARPATERRDVLIVDTAGRLHIDEELMDELAQIRKRTKPHDVLLVVDAMTGQDAVGVAETFAEAAEFDGVVMTKLDGDARGGAALSVKAVTGKPILFASTGEKLEELRALPPRPHGLAHPRHGRRPQPDRESRAAGRRGPGRRAPAEDPKATSSRSRTSSSRCARCARWARSAACSG